MGGGCCSALRWSFLQTMWARTPPDAVDRRVPELDCFALWSEADPGEVPPRTTSWLELLIESNSSLWRSAVPVELLGGREQHT